MLSLEQTKQLLNDPNLTDKDVELIRDEARAWAELAFQQWKEERTTAQNKSPNNELKNEPGG